MVFKNCECFSVVFLPSCLSDIAGWLTYADKGDADIYDDVDVDVDVDVDDMLILVVDVDVDVDVSPAAFPLFCLSG